MEGVKTTNHDKLMDSLDLKTKNNNMPNIIAILLFKILKKGGT